MSLPEGEMVNIYDYISTFNQPGVMLQKFKQKH